MKNKADRRIFTEGLEVVVKKLHPIAIIVYGSAPDDIFSKYKESGIIIVPFESEFSKRMNSMKEAV